MALNLNCLLLSAVTGYLPNPVEDAGRLIYPGYPSVTDTLLAISSTAVASSSVALADPDAPLDVVGTVDDCVDV